MQTKLGSVGAGSSKNRPYEQDPDDLKDILRRLACHSSAVGGQYSLMYFDANGNGHLNSSGAYKPYLENWYPSEVQKHARSLAITAAQDKAARKGNHSGKGKQIEADPSVFDPQVGWGASNPMLQGLQQQTSHTELLFEQPQYQSTQPSPVKSSNKRKATKDLQRVELSNQESTEYVALKISDSDALSQFYLTRFRQMQQQICKAIAKPWIKVIEPKKQTHRPYNRGDTSKPTWWPAEVRHKEPDHLMKPERLQLMLVMIRSGLAPIHKMEEATYAPDIMAKIPKERLPLLQEVFRVAKQEERFRDGQLPPSTIINVASSDKTIRTTSRKAARQSPSETHSQGPQTPMPSSRSSLEEASDIDDSDAQQHRTLSDSAPSPVCVQSTTSPMQYLSYVHSPLQSPSTEFLVPQVQQMSSFYVPEQPQHHSHPHAHAHPHHRHSVAFPVQNPTPLATPAPTNPAGYWSPQLHNQAVVNRVQFGGYGGEMHAPMMAAQGGSGPVSPGAPQAYGIARGSPMQGAAVLHQMQHAPVEQSQGHRAQQGFTDFLESGMGDGTIEERK